MTPKQEAYAALFEAAAAVYPPMVVTAFLRIKEERKNKRPSASVHPIRKDAGIHLRPVPPSEAPAPQPAPPPNPAPAAPSAQVIADSELVPGFTGPAFDPFKIEMPQ